MNQNEVSRLKAFEEWWKGLAYYVRDGVDEADARFGFKAGWNAARPVMKFKLPKGYLDEVPDDSE